MNWPRIGENAPATGLLIALKIICRIKYRV